VAIALVRDLRQMVDFGGRDDGLITQSIIQSEARIEPPGVAEVVLLLPVPKAAIELANAEAEPAGHAQQKIGDGVVSELAAKGDGSAIAMGRTAVDLQAVDFEAQCPDVIAADLPGVGRIAEPILHAIDGQDAARAKGFE